MKLRRQLLLLSLVALVLPWAGYQYLQEMDQVLRDSQTATLSATARAVAARLAAEPTLLHHTHQGSPLRSDLARQLYAHALPHAPVMDGYSEEWRGWGFAPRQFTHPQAPDFSAQITTGTYRDRLYLLISVDDPITDYHHPGRPELASGDHLVLAFNTEGGLPRYLVVTTSAPGQVSVYGRDDQGRTIREHRISGFWQERTRGYQVELQVPLHLTRPGFALAIVDNGPSQHPRYLGTLDDSALLVAGANDPGILPPVTGELIHPLPDLQAALAIFEQPGIRLQVADRDGWRLASSGSPELSQTENDAPHGLLTLFYRAALAPKALPEYQDNRDGRIDSPLIESAWLGGAGTYWQQQGQRQLGSAAAAIHLPPEHAQAIEDLTLGIVLAETSSDRLLALTNSAFGRLLTITLSSMLILALVLLGYASWLSWRIRRLGKAARLAVANDGQINPELPWPQTRIRDELGDLSRNYQQLLKRLHGYTDYLKSLTGKLSHELRTPLAVVRSSLDNLEHEIQEPQAKVYLERASSGSQRLSQLLTAMSEASRVEASIASAEQEWIDLEQLVRDMAAAYADIHPDHRVRAEITPGSDYQILAAPELLVQLLDKLVDNAADFCPRDGEITLALAADTDTLILSVSNDGPPLPEQMKGQLFDSLVSVRAERSEQAHLGLGLYIVRLIAEYHGGQASAQNRPGAAGARFDIRLPLRS